MREPPRLMEWLLRRLVAGGERGESLLGDLREEYSRRVGGSSDGARLWYIGEATRLAARYGGHRVRRWIGGAQEFPSSEGASGRGGTRLMEAGREVRYALRRLRRSPGFTAVAIVMLALGIGVNAGSFALVDALAFRPLPVRDADRVVALFGTQHDSRYQDFSYQDYIDYRDGMGDAAAAVAGYSDGPVSVSGDGGAVMAWREMVTPGYFDVLRARVALGRLLRDDDENVVVLSHGFWQRRFAGDPSVIGRVIQLNGNPFTIVGVAGRGFTGTRLFSFAPELWVPVSMVMQIVPGSDGRLQARSGGWLSLIARLQPGVSNAEAKSVGDAVAARLGAAYPATHGERTIEVVDNEKPINPFAFSASQLQAAGLTAVLGVALVLLIACANVVSLLLARATSQRREIALRLSLGAGRARVVRQMILESMILSLAGGLAGLMIAWALVRLSAGMVPPLDFSTAYTPTVDLRVGLYTAIAVVAAGLMAGVLPAVREARADPASALRAGTGGASRRSRLLSGLVVAQLTLSLIALVGAGLFHRSLENARRMNPGFTIDRGLVVTVNPGLQGYSPEETRQFYDRLLRDARGLAGVTAVARGSLMPLDGNTESTRVNAQGRSAAPEDRLRAFYYAVDPGFFGTLGVRIVAGREFTESDAPSDPPRAVVNRTLADQLWPGEPAVGRRIQTGSVTADVIGVVEDIKLSMLRDNAQPMVALDLRQRPEAQTTMLVRTAGDPHALAGELRRVVQAIDPSLALIGLKTLEEQTRYTLSAAESGARAGEVFGVLALILAAAGLFGVVSYGAARASREIGIRVALGARRSEVVWMIVRRGMRLTLSGIGLGLAGSVVMSRLVSGLLYGVQPLDTLSFAAATGVLALVALVASWVPAVRAASVDPLVVLRAE